MGYKRYGHVVVHCSNDGCYESRTRFDYPCNRTYFDANCFNLATLCSHHIFTDPSGNVVDILEKPKNPPSDLAIGGIYMFDEKFWEYLDEEFEKNGTDFSISDITRRYVTQNNAIIRNIGEVTWVDCGTPENLINAGNLAFRGEITTNFDE